MNVEHSTLHIYIVHVGQVCYNYDLQRRTVRKRGWNVGDDGGKGAEMRERIVRRAALEFKDGMYANLGIGMPMLASNYIPEGMVVRLQSENGILGLVSFNYHTYTCTRIPAQKTIIIIYVLQSKCRHSTLRDYLSYMYICITV